MQFRTEIFLQKSLHTISHQTPIVCLGSCFAERIGARLEAGKFMVLVNPYGVIFNPVSLFELICCTLDQSTLPAHLYMERDGLWFHGWFHSQFWANTQTDLACTLQTQMQRTYHALKEARFLCITLGTAWVYQKKGTNSEGLYTDLVANCHKQPAHLFEKKLLTPTQIIAHFEAVQARLATFNPDLKVILTVSPVRHLKDTLELNAVSKAVLRLAVHEITQKSDFCSYFPASELLLDDLRDYRFYASDLLHPSEQGELYIWGKFAEAYFAPKTLQLLQQIQKIQTSLAHRPLQAGKTQYDFLEKLLNQIQTLPTYIDFEAEKSALMLRMKQDTA